MVLVKYGLSDGAIAGVWSAATEALLVPNIVENDDRYGYVLSAHHEDPKLLAQQYRVDLTRHTIMAKVGLEITADHQTFRADGLDECVVTVEPFTPCTLLLNGIPQELTQEDHTLILTAEAPAQFHISLALHATHWAKQPLTVEAV